MTIVSQQIDVTATVLPARNWDAERALMMEALDMASLWSACTALIGKALPCHSCSLLFDIEGLQPQQGRHHLEAVEDGHIAFATSLDVAAPYLDANPQVPWYTFSQISAQDAHALDRLQAQTPVPSAWREFLHLAFWDGARLDAVLSIRLRAARAHWTETELAVVQELYPLLNAGLRRVRKLEEERDRQAAVEGLLYGLPIAAVLVDAQLVPAFMSREAKRIFSRWRDIDERADRLPLALDLPLRQWLQQAPCRQPGMRCNTSMTLQHPTRPSQRLRIDISAPPEHRGLHTQHLLILMPEGQESGVVAESAQALATLQCLSPSERKVAMLVAEGLRNDIIAERLCRSRKTIESQISSIFRKLNVANRTQLARLLG